MTSFPSFCVWRHKWTTSKAVTSSRKKEWINWRLTALIIGPNFQFLTSIGVVIGTSFYLSLPLTLSPSSNALKILDGVHLTKRESCKHLFTLTIYRSFCVEWKIDLLPSTVVAVSLIIESRDLTILWKICCLQRFFIRVAGNCGNQAFPQFNNWWLTWSKLN